MEAKLVDDNLVKYSVHPKIEFKWINKLRNITRRVGERAKLTCVLQANVPLGNIVWYKNGVITTLIDKNLVVTQHSRKGESGGTPVYEGSSDLKIRKLELFDKGFYECRVKSQMGHHEVSSDAVLLVDHENAGELPVAENKLDIPSVIGENLKMVRENISSMYDVLLRGSNDKNTESFQSGRNHQKCELYSGNICKDILGNQTIYVNSMYGQQGKYERDLEDIFYFLNYQSGFSGGCLDALYRALCHQYFPACKLMLGVHVISPRQICRQDCELIRTSFCRHEFYESLHSSVQPNLALPDCKSLALEGTSQAIGCLSLNMDKLRSAVHGDEFCYHGNGKDFRGKVSETISGELCLPWTNRMKLDVMDYPELSGGHSYCRNPGGMEEAPWCFTSSAFASRQRCAIPRCVTGSIIAMAPLTIAVIVFTLSLIAFLLTLLFWLKRKPDTSSPPETNSSFEMETLARKTIKHKINRIGLDELEFMEIIGEGNFGKVFKGMANISSTNHLIMVAIKTLKITNNPNCAEEFFREVNFMAGLRHNNIVSLLGVVTSQQLQCMVFEFMNKGDLRSYLLTHSPQLESGEGRIDREAKIITLDDMLYISTQISAGMSYLAANHYVHRDLAARNVLINDKLTVKISDFGLSRDVHSCDYYRLGKQELLPVRWMPPESFSLGKFTKMSDIWSFGVTLWEIYSFGSQPYLGYSNHEVVQLIRSRMILPCPEICPLAIYSLMRKCWNLNPERRPTFEEIHRIFRKWLLSVVTPPQAKNLNGVISQKPSYVNVPCQVQYDRKPTCNPYYVSTLNV